MSCEIPDVLRAKTRLFNIKLEYMKFSFIQFVVNYSKIVTIIMKIASKHIVEK